MRNGPEAGERAAFREGPFPLRKALPVLCALMLPLGTAVRAGTGPTPVLRVEPDADGRIALDARGVTIEAALHAIADEAGFQVVITPGIERPLVNMTVSATPVEGVLREILRGRNYSLVYDENGAFLSQVVVLPPPAANQPSPALRQPFRSSGTRPARSR